jgi:hypothetical protein
LVGRLAAWGLALGLLLLVACGPDTTPRRVRGLVVNLQAASFSQLGSFDLRADDGRAMTFAVDGDVGVTPSHLREHMTLAEPVTVTYHDSRSGLVATRVDD